MTVPSSVRSEIFIAASILGPGVNYSNLVQSGYISDIWPPGEVTAILHSIPGWSPFIHAVDEIETRPVNGKRMYHISEDERYYSVTTILGMMPGATQFYRSQANIDATILGTYVHYRIGCDLAIHAGYPLPQFEPVDPLPDRKIEEFWKILESWAEFKSLTKPRLLNEHSLEMAVYHPELQYAGRADAILVLDLDYLRQEISFNAANFTLLSPGKWRPGPFLVDFKTGQKYNTHGPQLAAYWLAYNRIFPDSNIQRAATLRMSKGKWWFTEIDLSAAVLGWKDALAALEQTRQYRRAVDTKLKRRFDTKFPSKPKKRLSI